MAIGAAGLHLSPLEALAQGLLPAHSLGPDYYPPALTGMRVVSMVLMRSLTHWHARVEHSVA